jgi:hypothetical protein
LDVTSIDGIWRVQHDDLWFSDAARLEEVLAWSEIRTYDQPLYIEVKEREPTAAKIEALLDLVLNSGVARNGRPVFFRSFVDERIENIHLINEQLAGGAHPLQAPYVRTHVLYSDSSFDETEEYTASIEDAFENGHDGVAFERTTPDLFHLVHFAQNLGMGAGVWTVPESMGEVWCAGLREDIDALIVDINTAECRTVVEEDTNLLHFDSASDVSDESLVYRRDDTTEWTVDLLSDDAPSSVVSTCCEGLYGTSLNFVPSYDQHLSFYDADNRMDEGYFLVLTVQFDDLDLAHDEKQVLFSKADDGGFALEVKGEWFGGPTLQFGVHVDGEYHWATTSLSGINTDHSHLIMAAYDGEGRARIWLNNSDGGVDETDVLDGGVTQNDSPVTIGADPQGWSDTRYHFNGRIQMGILQKWRNH